MRRLEKTTTLGLLSTLLMGAAVFACGPSVAEAHRPWHDSGHYHQPQPIPAQEVSVNFESPEGGVIQTYWHDGSLYVAGHNGSRYNLRLQNNTGERVEAVVTVDGRDVVSGQLGNYKTQRGYVIEAYGSVTIEGFRQSLEQVAAFRFTDIGNSYSARRGSPQHVGVIGVAVFKEHQPRFRPRPQPTPIATRPYYEPYAGGDAGGYDYKSAESRNAPAADPAPAAPPMGGAGRAKSAYDYDDVAAESAMARPRSNRLGTEYGESTYSAVREVSFTRKHSRRPDSLLTVYYDSLDGLRARGVPVDPVYYPPAPLYPPQAFPDNERHNQYAPPPPPRRY